MSMRVHIALKGITDLGLLVEALREMGITNEDPISAGAALPAGNVLISGFWKGYRVRFAKDKNGEIHSAIKGAKGGGMQAPDRRHQKSGQDDPRVSYRRIL